MPAPRPQVLGWVLKAAMAALLGMCLEGQSGPPTATSPADLAQIGLPDAQGAARFLERFRSRVNAENFYMEFDLTALPRKGEETVYRGRLWAGRTAEGPVNRFAIMDSQGVSHVLLVQSGPGASVWRLEGGHAVPVGIEVLFGPLVPGLQMTAFDLQMPFFSWPEAKLASITRIRGRPAYQFIFSPPESFQKARSELKAVRAYLDTEYAAPVQIEYVGADTRTIKTWSLVDLKKVGDRWTVKDLDVRNEVTRDKARFSATAIAFGDFLDGSLFDPARLGEPVSPPAEQSLIPVGP